jgi:hypothetical protein
MKRIATIFLVIVMMMSFSACFFVEEIEEVILITSEDSPDGNYTVSLYQLGSPQWSFGSVDAKLVLTDREGAVIDQVKFGLANDGAGVGAGNIEKITWLDNQVEIIMGESDTTRKFTFVLSYSA